LVKVRTLHCESDKVLKEVAFSTPTSREKDAKGEAEEEAVQQDEEERCNPCQISFFNLSYWVLDVPDWKSPFRVIRKQILREISGELNNKSVTAIMGPSGSGKTTLLKLLGGQIHHGEFSGARLLNGHLLKGSKFDQVMRNQGYVSQQDNLLETLTVWQTITFATMLRMPDSLSTTERLRRASKIMTEMGLISVANSVVGGGLSGGQRRRLSIALELLGNPSVLLLDECTSGLDATSSLRLVKSLRKMSRLRGTTVVLTIHQPRAEVFSLFDSLILLGTGGFLVYSGPTVQAASLLSQAPCVSLNLEKYDNPGDFIIDVLGLGGGMDIEENVTVAESAKLGSASTILGKLASLASTSLARDNKKTINKSLAQNSEENSSEENDHKDIEMSNLTFSNRFSIVSRTTTEDDEESSSLLNGVSPPPFARGGGGEGVIVGGGKGNGEGERRRRKGGGREEEGGNDDDDVMMTALMVDLNKHFEASTLYKTLAKRFRIGLRQWFSMVESPPARRDVESLNLHRVSSSPLSQVWVLFARRIQVFKPRTQDFILFLIEIVFVSGIVVFAFSYSVDTQLEKPYQILMLFFMISTYAMILQYLVLIPEYIIERRVLHAERSSGILSFGPYIASTMLTEIPRAVVQCTILVIVLYTIHPLNPDFINVTFCLVCLMVGVTAWQSLICVCAVATDTIGVAYTISFLALGSGSLFGGLMVRLDKIPHIFRFLYYISVTAVTQRALLVNDLQCCYLTATCQSIADEIKNINRGPPGGQVGPGGFAPGKDGSDNENGGGFMITRFLQSFNSTTHFDSTTICPPGLQITGDGSDGGNLGRLYLSILGLERDNPFAGLLFLFWANILFRMVACFILYCREFLRSNLKEVFAPN